MEHKEAVQALLDLSRHPFYSPKTDCPKHNKYSTYVCLSCMIQPQCEICWKENPKEHQGHNYFKVCKASQKACIDVADITRCFEFDITGIQVNIINNKNVLYLNTEDNNRDQRNVSNDSRKIPRCRKCSRQLKSPEYSYCSILCRLESGEAIRRVVERNSLCFKTTCSNGGVATSNEKLNVSQKIKKVVLSFRKRSRKGTNPRRAPLF